ncbi:MAG: N-acetylmuramoyl-L-alanine amidase [bacterium]|nr:N-acetylmuramoyl-L-alanine amidase [bacterium]
MKKELIKKLICFIAFANLLFSPVLMASPKKNTVETISYSNNKVIINVEQAVNGKRPSYKYNTLSGNRFYIDILDSRVEKPLDFKASKGIVSRIRRNQFNHTTSRIVLHLRNNVKPKVRYIEDLSRFEIIFGKSTANKSKKAFRVLIDPGHGGKLSPGVVGPSGTREKDVTLAIAKKLQKLLGGRDDIEVFMTRKSDQYISLSSRRYLSKKYGVDLFISIHANGNEIRYFPDQIEIYYRDSKGKKLANHIKYGLKSKISGRKTDIRRNNYFTVIRRNPARFGSVLVETGYLSNPHGEKRLKNSDYQLKIAKGLYESIDSFINSSYY